MRDDHGVWLRGFMSNLGIWAVCHGLNIAWELNVPKLLMRIDSEKVVSWFCQMRFP